MKDLELSQTQERIDELQRDVHRQSESSAGNAEGEAINLIEDISAHK